MGDPPENQSPDTYLLIADVTEEQRAALQSAVIEIGYLSWSDYVRDMATHVEAVKFVGRWSMEVR